MKNIMLFGLIVTVLLLVAYIQRGTYQCQGLDVVFEKYPQGNVQ